MMQIIFKAFVSIIVLLMAGWGLYRFWLIDIDLGKLLSPRFYFNLSKRSLEEKLASIPQRETTALYQNGEMVAKVENAQIDLTEKLCRFDKIFEANKLNYNQPFEFRSWVLQFKSAQTIAMITFNANGVNEGQTFKIVECEILKER